MLFKGWTSLNDVMEMIRFTVVAGNHWAEQIEADQRALKKLKEDWGLRLPNPLIGLVHVLARGGLDPAIPFTFES